MYGMLCSMYQIVCGRMLQSHVDVAKRSYYKNLIGTLVCLGWEAWDLRVSA